MSLRIPKGFWLIAVVALALLPFRAGVVYHENRRPARDTLPEGPLTFDTATRGPSGSIIVGPKVRVVPMKGLSYPYALTFLPDGNILITERGGQLRIVR